MQRPCTSERPSFFWEDPLARRTVLWAPYASRVDLVVDSRRFPMEPIDSGRFAVDHVPPHGQDYGFSLNGGRLVPDPRSPWQPHGVNRRSRGYDHDAFDWSTPTWRTTPLAGSSCTSCMSAPLPRREPSSQRWTGWTPSSTSVSRPSHLCQLRSSSASAVGAMTA